MLKRHQRISRSEFTSYFKRGVFVRGKYAHLKYTKSTDPARFAVVVSKKVYKTAVKRNHLRRTIMSCIEEYLTHSTCTGVYIFLATQDAPEASRADICCDVTSLLSRRA